MNYVAPVKDQRFVLEQIIGLDQMPAPERLDGDTLEGLLEEAARFFESVFAPLNTVGDQQGSRVIDGRVVTPDGFGEAYARYVESGWGALPFDPAHGGGGLPWAVALAVQEIVTATNMGLSLCPLLTQGAVDLLSAHGSEEQQALYLPRMVTGEWTGTMNLTEPAAGSDVGAVRTRAVPAGDGTYRISGQKIYITYGDHDLADNIIHLVLARTPDAAPGTRGISCFIVPKFLVDEDGSLGEANRIETVSSEHKVGIHASPTCVLAFDEAVGYLIGEEQAGMSYMFTMMNNARLSVGLQGLALAERAYQQALSYANERVQGRAVGSQRARGEGSPIIEHPDVARMLLLMRSQIEAMRCVHYRNAAALDRAHHGDQDAIRAAGEAEAALLTPISKAWGTDLGVELTSLAIQIHGGMGYVEETGVAQHWRDARIAPIYEGTNGIQATDLVFRKLPMAGGAVVAELVSELGRLMTELEGVEELSGLAHHLGEGTAAIERTSAWVLETLPRDPVAVAGGAVAACRLFGCVLGGAELARSALRARALLAAGETEVYDREFLEAKLVMAEFYGTQVLPEAPGLAAIACHGPAVMSAAGVL